MTSPLFCSIRNLFPFKSETKRFEYSETENPLSAQSDVQSLYPVLKALTENSPFLFNSLEHNDGAIMTALLASEKQGRSGREQFRVDLESKDSEGDTLLLQAAKKGDYPKAIQKLLQGGADPLAKDSEGRTGLALSATQGNNQSFMTLLKHAKAEDCQELPDYPYSQSLPGEALAKRPMVRVNAADNQGRTPLMNALRAGNNFAAYELTENGAALNRRDHQGKTALIWAAQRSNPYAIIRLLSLGAQANAQDSEGKTALMHWTTNVKVEPWTNSSIYTLGKKLISGKFGLPSFIRASKALSTKSQDVINVQDKDGKTALSHLANSPLREANPIFFSTFVLSLLKNDANPDIPDNDQNTPLMYLAKRKSSLAFTNGIYSIALLSRSRQPNYQNQAGKTALIHAAENGELTLLGALAFFTPWGRQRLGNIFSRADAQPVNLNIQDREGQSALMALTQLKDSDYQQSTYDRFRVHLVKAITAMRRVRVPEGAFVDYKNHLANVAQLLIRAGADPTLKDKKGETALMKAVLRNNLAMLQVLAKSPQTLGQKNANGQTALDLARQHHQAQAVQILLEASKEQAESDRALTQVPQGQ